MSNATAIKPIGPRNVGLGTDWFGDDGFVESGLGVPLAGEDFTGQAFIYAAAAPSFDDLLYSSTSMSSNSEWQAGVDTLLWDVQPSGTETTHTNDEVDPTVPPPAPPTTRLDDRVLPGDVTTPPTPPVDDRVPGGTTTPPVTPPEDDGVPNGGETTPPADPGDPSWPTDSPTTPGSGGNPSGSGEPATDTPATGAANDPGRPAWRVANDLIGMSDATWSPSSNSAASDLSSLTAANPLGLF